METFTAASTLPTWTNPTTCPGGAVQCGHIAVAVPISAPLRRPEAWILDGGSEEVIDGTGRHQHGELTFHSHQYRVILTDRGDIPAGATVTLQWLPWDGTGAAPIPAP